MGRKRREKRRRGEITVLITSMLSSASTARKIPKDPNEAPPVQGPHQPRLT
jgi:hypothetical protein